jgi:hypothetical protein
MPTKEEEEDKSRSYSWGLGIAGTVAGAAILGFGLSYFLSGNKTQENEDSEQYSSEEDSPREESVKWRRMALRCLNNNALDEVKFSTQPTKQENNSVNKKFDKIVRLIQQEVGPMKIIKTGSFGRGVHVSPNFDVDMSVYVDNKFFEYGDLKTIRELYETQIQKIRADILNCLNMNLTCEFSKSDPHMIKVLYGSVWFDIIVTPNIPIEHARTLIQECTQETPFKRFISNCLAEDRLKSYKYTAPEVKTMIRVAKYWVKCHNWSHKKYKPLSFFIETLMLQVCEKARNAPSHVIFIFFLKNLIEVCYQRIEIVDAGTGIQIHPCYSYSLVDEVIQFAKESLREMREKY